MADAPVTEADRRAAMSACGWGHEENCAHWLATGEGSVVMGEPDEDGDDEDIETMDLESAVAQAIANARAAEREACAAAAAQVAESAADHIAPETATFARELFNRFARMVRAGEHAKAGA